MREIDQKDQIIDRMQNDLTTLRSIQKMLEHRIKEGFESLNEENQLAGKNGERASKNN